MVRAVLCGTMVVLLALNAQAADEPAATTAKEKEPVKANAWAVTAKNPLSAARPAQYRPYGVVVPTPTPPLRPPTLVPGTPTSSMPVFDPYMPPSSPMVPTARPYYPTPQPYNPGPPVAAAAPREVVVIRLENAPAVDVAQAIEKLLAAERKSFPPGGAVMSGITIVPDAVSNSLLVSGSSEAINNLTEIVEALDRRPDCVMVDFWIAELKPKASDGDSDEAAEEETPCPTGDGAAWIAWAKKHRRISVLGRPQIMTLDNQQAMLHIGQQVPIVAATSSSQGGRQVDRAIRHEDVGLVIDLTPRISTEGRVTMQLHIERSWLSDQSPVVAADDSDAPPVVRLPVVCKMFVQTTLTVEDGKTVVLGGLLQGGPHPGSDLIVAVTPRINPQKE